jgi:hypothetical protein
MITIDREALIEEIAKAKAVYRGFDWALLSDSTRAFIRGEAAIALSLTLKAVALANPPDP